MILQRLRDSARETAQFQVVLSCSRENSNQHTQAAAVDEVNVAEVQDESWRARDDLVDVLAECRRLVSLDDPAVAFQNGDVADRTAAQ